MEWKDVEIAVGLRLLALIQAAFVFSDGRVGTRAGRVPILLLRSRGRRSGVVRTVALTYVGGAASPAVIGSRGGSDAPPAWALNLRADPRAEIQLGRTRRPVVAREAKGAERDRLWEAANRLWNYERYQARTRRRIPVFVLDPAPHSAQAE